MKKYIFPILILAILIFSLASCGGHVCEWSEWMALEGEEPTCMQAGKEYRVCLKDPEHIEERDREALGHTFGGEWTVVNGKHSNKCSVCKSVVMEAHKSNGIKNSAGYENCEICGYELKPFDSQRVIFLGNSYVFYGNAVNEKKTTETRQSARENDKGYFYRICKENGREVSVTNWTFGGHTIKSLFDDECKIDRDGCSDGGVCHKDDLVNRYYDYVFVSPGSGTTEEKNIISTFETVIAFFKEANPNVKVVCLGNLGPYSLSSGGALHEGISNSYKTLEDMGVIIADWGSMVYDIMNGEAALEGATQEYNKKSFVGRDGFHPNPLCGYLQSLMAYCVVTGEGAVGQSYDFMQKSFDVKSWIGMKGPSDTNLLSIIESEADMLALQKLMDEYIAAKPYRNFGAAE